MSSCTLINAPGNEQLGAFKDECFNFSNPVALSGLRHETTPLSSNRDFNVSPPVGRIDVDVARVGSDNRSHLTEYRIRKNRQLRKLALVPETSLARFKENFLRSKAPAKLKARLLNLPSYEGSPEDGCSQSIRKRLKSSHDV